MKFFRALPTFFFISIISCHEQNTNDSKKVKQELRSREVVHLTNSQINERAWLLGDTIIQKAESDMAAGLNSSKENSCIPAFKSISEKLFSEYQSTLQRMTFNPERLKSISSKKEREVMDAYFYNYENHLPISSNLQQDGEKEFLYSKPLVLSEKSCLPCHQAIGNPLLKGNAGDTIGIWNLRFFKKQVVMSFVD